MVAEAMKAKAEVCLGDKTCRERFGSLLTEIGLPNRLLSNQEIEECGYVKDTGFVWLKHKKKKEDLKRKHQNSLRFDNVVVCFEDEITAYFEPNRIKKLTGVKAKEFLVWISLGEIHVNRSIGLITFKTQRIFLYTIAMLDYDQDESETCNYLIKKRYGIHRLASYSESICRFSNALEALRTIMKIR